MKTTRRISLFFALALALLLSALLLASCGEESPKVDIHALADELIEKAAFEDEPVARREDTVAARYGLTAAPYVDQATYATGGATAEEIAIFEASDAKAAEAILEAMEKYLSSQIRTYDSYNPAGVVNLEAGCLVRHGKYVVYCVCADASSAKTVIDAYFPS